MLMDRWIGGNQGATGPYKTHSELRFAELDRRPAVCAQSKMGGGGQNLSPSLAEAKAKAKAKADGPAMWMSSKDNIVGEDGRLLWRIHGVDYDLERFVAEHPGGELAIRLGQGIDATDLFESYHSSQVSFRALEKHRVVAGDAPKLGTSAFKRDLDEVVRRPRQSKVRPNLLCKGGAAPDGRRSRLAAWWGLASSP